MYNQLHINGGEVAMVEVHNIEILGVIFTRTFATCTDGGREYLVGLSRFKWIHTSEYRHCAYSYHHVRVVYKLFSLSPACSITFGNGRVYY